MPGRVRPHAKVHLTARSHRRTAELFTDPTQRGIYLGVLMCSVAAYAAKTENKVILTKTDLMWITGISQVAHAERALSALCARMEWAMSALGACWVVNVRNLQQKQGFGPKNENLRTPNSEHRTQNSDYGSSRSALSDSAQNGTKKPLTSAMELPWELPREPNETRDQRRTRVLAEAVRREAYEAANRAANAPKVIPY